MKGHVSTTPENEKDFAQTPQWFFDALERHVMRRKFKLDVCAEMRTAKCKKYYTLQRGQDGLKESWSSLNWCNPPFSNITPWVEKAVKETFKGKDSVMIMPNNPETEYVRMAKAAAQTIIEMPFRLQFVKPDGTPFLTKKGKPSTPQFSCLLALFTPLGLHTKSQNTYIDFREWRK